MEGWTNSLSQLNVKADIAFFGDSLTFWGDFASLFPDRTVCNLGLRGDTVSGMKSRVEQLAVVHPKTIFIQGGINDAGRSTPREFEIEYEQLCEKTIDMIPDAEIILQTMLPVNNDSFGTISCTNKEIISFNDTIRATADKMRLPCLDLFSLYVEDDKLPECYSLDGIHLKPDAYDAWYRAITRLMNH